MTATTRRADPPATLLLLLLVSVAPLFAACSSAPGPEGILGAWEAGRVEVGATAHEFGGGGEDGLIVEFGTDGSFAGEAPCNGFTGEFDFDGDTLDTADLVRSAAVCLDSGREIEELVFSLLETTRFTVTFDGDAMTWGADGILAEFTRR